MLLVSDILARLSRGPLSNLAIGMDGAGTIQSDKVQSIIDHLNDGLLKLHVRFVLNERQVIIGQIDGLSLYPITSSQSETLPAPGSKQYIKDASDPFTDDLIKILSVVDDCGRELPLNDDTACDSVFTPRIDTLQIPEPKTGKSSFVMYQAKHPWLTAPTDSIDIPLVLENALINWAAHKVFSNMNGQEHLIKAKDLLDQFNADVMLVEDKDMVNSSVSEVGRKFCERGFV